MPKGRGMHLTCGVIKHVDNNFDFFKFFWRCYGSKKGKKERERKGEGIEEKEE